MNLAPDISVQTSVERQGLTYFDGYLYEGTGLEHQSSLMRHDPANQMRTLEKIPVTPTHLFGEGISHYYVWRTDEQTGKRVKEHRLIQLTWKDKWGKIYSLPGLELLKEFSYDTVTGEGWGITFVPHRNEFYVSDGSEYLIVWDAETLEEKRKITVTFDWGDGAVESIKYVNELEFVDFAVTNDELGDEANGESQCQESGTCSGDASSPLFTPTMRILANLWYQDVLVSIDPVTGAITRVYDLRDIYPLSIRQREGADCLNGISTTGNKDNREGLEVWVTGKLWKNMYRIRLIN